MSNNSKNEKTSRAPIQRIQESLRDLVSAMDGLNQAVGERVSLRPVDLEVLDSVDREGPLSPRDLVRKLSIHPATLTGVLDRLEAGGWVERLADPSDRRRVVVRALRTRGGELRRLYGPMARSLADICADFSPAELEAIQEFLDRVAEAARRSRPREGSD